MRRQVQERELVSTIENNMKKAVTQMLVLQTLSERERYIREIAEAICEYTDYVIKVQLPYRAVSELLKDGCVKEKKQVAADGRLRLYYSITQRGQAYLSHLRQVFFAYTEAVKILIAKSENNSL